MLNIVFLIGGLTLTLLSANWLVKGSSLIALKLKIPKIVIGLTIVAIGTSTPEFVINVISSIKGKTDIAIGNVIGSNISNILLIMGLTAIIHPLDILKNTQFKEIPLALVSTFLLLITANDVFFDKLQTNFIGKIDGIILLIFFLLFMLYSITLAKNTSTQSNEENNPEKETIPLWKSLILVSIGIAGLFIGGEYFVEGAVNIAKILGLSESVIGLTIVSVGTSLPELTTSVVSAIKKQPDLAVGNIVGSNIINIFLILGCSAIINPLYFIPDNNIDIFICIFSTFLLFLFTFILGKRIITRMEGLIFLVFYIAYLIYLINWHA